MRHFDLSKFDLSKALMLALCTRSTVALVQDGHRILCAATRRSDLLKRDTSIVQKFESELVYIEGQQNRETFASTVTVRSRKPIVNLEEIEHFLYDVQCKDGRMMLHFTDEETAQDARAACHGGHGGTSGLIITSHQSCNKESERAVYKIDDVSFTEQGATLDLAVTEALWQDAFDHLDIEFGHIPYDHVYRRHSNFLRARGKLQDNFTVEALLDAPDNVTTVTFHLTSELLDYTFTVDDFLSGLDSVVELPINPALPVEVGCTNCSTRGQITLKQGAIKIDTQQIDLVPDIFEGGNDGKGFGSVITGGYLDLAVTGIGARLEMYARPTRSGSYEVALFPVPILGFVIPGIGQAGASFEPKISADFDTDGELAVKYGVDVTVPGGTRVRVELGDLMNSTITSIEGATIHALPFSSNVTDADFALSLAFTPTIPIGFKFSDKLSALVTIALDLPRLDAKLIAGAKAQCSLPTKNESALEDADLGSHLLIESNISVVIDVSADITLPFLPAPFNSTGASANIFSTQMLLMSSCVSPAQGTLSITEMVPMATTISDKAIVPASTTSTCRKHEADKPCPCAMVTTTVYAAPPMEGCSDLTPLEMTPYHPTTPTDLTYEAGTTFETSTARNAYGPIEQPPMSTPCISSQKLRITISTTLVSITESPTQLSIVIISVPRSKPCDSSSTEIPASSIDTTATNPSSTSEINPLSASSQNSAPRTTIKTKTEAALTLSTTSPPKVEESKGFMDPPDSGTDTSAVVISTGLTEFTGAAIPGVAIPQLRKGVEWQIVMLAAGLGAGALLI